MESQTQNTEKRIIEASFRVIECNGVSGATTRKIADEAGLSEVTLFRKFKSKDGILEAVKEYYTQYFIDIIEDAFSYEEDSSVEDYLEKIFLSLVNLPENDFNIIKFALEESHEVPEGEKVFKSIFKSIMDKLCGFFTLKIQQGEIRALNPKVIALNVFGIIFETTVLWRLYDLDSKENIDQYFGDFLEILLKGISSEA